MQVSPTAEDIAEPFAQHVRQRLCLVLAHDCRRSHVKTSLVNYRRSALSRWLKASHSLPVCGIAISLGASGAMMGGDHGLKSGRSCRGRLWSGGWAT